MSNVFTYAIDERNLKIQLRSMEAPLKEEAFHKFEQFTTAHPFKAPQSNFAALQINLNRNVVLPVVFGVIICLFSFLLFNFISIKDPQATTAQKTDKASPALTAAVKKTPERVITPPTQKVEVQEAKITPAVQQSFSKPVVTEAPAYTFLSEIGSSTSIEPSSTEAAAGQNQTVATSTDIKPEAQVKKRARKSDADQQLLEIRPTTVTDEGDVEVPN